MELSPKLQANCQQKLILTQAMLRSLEILQLSQLELGELIRDEIEKNPLLEIDSDNFTRLPVGQKTEQIFQDLPARPSLSEHLQTQMREVFDHPTEREIAEQLIGLLDERGYITELIDPSQRSVLLTLQTFDPPGIFARSCQETFLIQLERSGQKESLIFQLVQHAFDDLLHARYGKLEKKFRVSTAELTEAISKLARLKTRPASEFETSPTKPIYPDLQVVKMDEKWMLEPIEDALPKFRIKTEYCSLSGLPKDQKETLKGFTASANWLIQAIERRKQLLFSIGTHLVKNQTAYLDNSGPLESICPSELAILFSVHESTISRALADKYISSPMGVIPLRSLVSSHGNESAKQLLIQLIARENKRKPLTDDQLAENLKKSGYDVARRTVAKYRMQFKIGSALARRRCHSGDSHTVS